MKNNDINAGNLRFEIEKRYKVKENLNRNTIYYKQDALNT